MNKTVLSLRGAEKLETAVAIAGLGFRATSTAVLFSPHQCSIPTRTHECTPAGNRVPFKGAAWAVERMECRSDAAAPDTAYGGLWLSEDTAKPGLEHGYAWCALSWQCDSCAN
ncbi:hypothetical protein BBP40_007248 [Aspergillus hancockii]|nr:hypothetical protein BBP40_007248 [Aspergillus hancockii]